MGLSGARRTELCGDDLAILGDGLLADDDEASVGDRPDQRHHNLVIIVGAGAGRPGPVRVRSWPSSRHREPPSSSKA